MKKREVESSKAEHLRHKAEDKLSQEPEQTQHPVEADAQALVHELQVHQIELEMQNDELQRVNSELEEMLSKYSDLYDFAPVGYFTLDEQGTIVRANLAGADLLGKPRSELINKSFRQFLPPDSLAGFDACRRRILANRTKQTCEAKLLLAGIAVYVSIEGVSAEDANGDWRFWRIATTDITQRKKAEVELQRAHDELEARVKERTRELAEVNQALRAQIIRNQQAQQRERELEAQQIEFYRRTILAATDGKLMIAEPDDIRQLVGAPLAEWQIRTADELTTIRLEAVALARSEGMDEEEIQRLSTCIGEATSNALKHAGGGRSSFHRIQNAVVFKVEDKGFGIGAMSIPDVALVRGYSTVGTLGMGYKMMISAADRVYLATGPEGTTVACIMNLHRDNEPSDPLLRKNAV